MADARCTDLRCTCGMSAIVHGSVPDASCPFHGDKRAHTIHTWHRSRFGNGYLCLLCGLTRTDEPPIWVEDIWWPCCDHCGCIRERTGHTEPCGEVPCG